MNDWRSYDAVAQTYARVRSPMTALVATDLVAVAAPPAGGRVLDVGTGTGSAAEAALRLVEPEGLSVGVDRSPAMLAAGGHAGSRARFAAAEAIQLPFRDATFDVVLANFAMTEFTRYDTALFDILRVIRPGGRLAASTWAVEKDELMATWDALVVEAIGEEMLRSARQEATPWAERFGDPVRLEGTLRDAGLRPVAVERRSYRFHMSRDDYVAEQETRALGRFVREMLGEREWEGFARRARARFAATFPDQIGDRREVLLAVGTKP